MTEMQGRLPGIRVRPEDIPTHGLVVGDPARAAAASKHLTDAKEVGNFREYLSFAGTYKGKRVIISSHGVGAAGAALCFESLMYGGCKTIIRAGTCGAYREDIQDGDFIISLGNVREDGTSDQLIPMSYPALAHYQVVRALELAARNAGFSKPHMGIVWTHANFIPGLLPNMRDMWMQANVIGVEMELSCLLVIASLRGARAGGILVSDGNYVRRKREAAAGKVYNPFTDYNPMREVVFRGVETMITVALDALVSL